MPAEPADEALRDSWELAGRVYTSRLLVGTGKYRDFEQTQQAIEASGAQIVTVAIRRVNIGQDRSSPNLLDYLPEQDYTILPNTAGCRTAEEAIRTARQARELLGGSPLVKLEVIGDGGSLYPDGLETLRATEILAREGFWVLVYTTDDPVLARRLTDAGARAVMPLAAPIGSGLGLLNPYNIRLIIREARVPVLVDAGVGTASDAAVAMELGCEGVLMNTAIARAGDPVRMARAMRAAVIAGRLAFQAGPMARPDHAHAHASSPARDPIP